jgi:hypothetical protein
MNEVDRRVARRKRARLLTVCVAAIAAVVSVPALAAGAGHKWWYERTASSAPSGYMANIHVLGPPTVIATGEADGRRWTAVAYIDKPTFDNGREGACFAIIVGSLTGAPAWSGCGAHVGMPEPAWVKKPKADFEGWFSFGDNPAWKGGPPLMTGTVGTRVSRLEMISRPDRSGKRITTEVPLERLRTAGQQLLAFAFPFYVDTHIDTVTAFDASGKVLEQYKNHPHP